MVECLKIITRARSLRIADYAFRLARETGRAKVTAVHKANIMWVPGPGGRAERAAGGARRGSLTPCPPLPRRKLGDGLFLQCCREVAGGYPEITFDSMIVDNTTMQVRTLASGAHSQPGREPRHPDPPALPPAGVPPPAV